MAPVDPPDDDDPPPLNAIDSTVVCPAGQIGWDFSTGGGNKNVDGGVPTSGKVCIPKVCKGKQQRDARMMCVDNPAMRSVSLPAPTQAQGQPFVMVPSSLDYSQEWIRKTKAEGAREDYRDTITLSEGIWGDWSPMMYCPAGYYANGFRQRVEGEQGGGDDTGLNAIELSCINLQGASTSFRPHDGIWGDWSSSSYCANNQFIRSGELRLEGNQGGGDDTAGANVRFRCTDNNLITANNGVPFGDWRGEKTCGANRVVCGAQVRFEGNQGGGDDSALNGVKLACCDAPGALANDASNSLRPIYQQVPYRYKAGVQTGGDAFQTKLAVWVTKRFKDRRRSQPELPQDVMPTVEGFVCTLTDLDIKKSVAGTGEATANSTEIGELISPECVIGESNALGDAVMFALEEEATQRASKKPLSESCVSRCRNEAACLQKCAQENVFAEREQLSFGIRNYDQGELVFHVSFDPWGDVAIPAGQGAGLRFNSTNADQAPNPPGFFYNERKRRINNIAFLRQREIALYSARSETSPRTDNALLHEVSQSTFAVPTKLLLAIEQISVTSPVIVVNPFDPVPPAVYVDVEWQRYGDIEANPYSDKRGSPRVDGVSKLGELSPRVAIEIRPTGAPSNEPWLKMGEDTLASDKAVATGSVNNVIARPVQSTLERLFISSAANTRANWAAATMFDVRACMDVNGLRSRPESTTNLRLPAIANGGYQFVAGFDTVDSACKTKAAALMVQREFIMRPSPPQRANADMGMVDATRSGSPDSEGKSDSGSEERCVSNDATRTQTCTTTSRQTLGGEGMFSRTMYSSSSAGTKTESETAGKASAKSQGEVMGFQVIDTNDAGNEKNWQAAPAEISIVIVPPWDLIIKTSEAAPPPPPPAPKPKFTKKTGHLEGLAVGLEAKGRILIGPIPGTLTAVVSAGVGVALELKMKFKPDEPYPCINSRGKKCFMLEEARLSQTQAARACVEAGGRLAEVRTRSDLEGIMAAAEDDDNYWIGGQLAYVYASADCRNITNSNRASCANGSKTSYRWIGSDREFARSNNTQAAVDFLGYTNIPVRPPGGVRLETYVPDRAGIAYQGEFKQLNTLPEALKLPSVCEFDAAPRVAYSDFSLGLKLAASAGVELSFFIPDPNIGFGIVGSLAFIEVALTPTIGRSAFDLYDTNRKWLGTRANAYTNAPWSVTLMSASVEAVANFVIASLRWPIITFDGFKVAEGMLWDIVWPARQGPELSLGDVTPDTSTPAGTRVVFEATAPSTRHTVGRLDTNGGWSANPSQDPAGYLVQTPATNLVGAGQNTVEVRLRSDANGGQQAVAIEVLEAATGRVIATRWVSTGELASANVWTDITLQFNQTTANTPLSFRVYYADQANVSIDRITVGALRGDYRGVVTIGDGIWGDWLGMRYCPEGSYASGYRMRVEGDQGGGDDTGLNAVELLCTEPGDLASEAVRSNAGDFGSWRDARSCTINNYIRGGRIRIEGNQGSGDDTAANSVEAQCTDNQAIEAPGATPWGGWSGVTNCPAGQVVCGLEARVEGNQGDGDDTALNGLRFACCAAPGPFVNFKDGATYELQPSHVTGKCVDVSGTLMAPTTNVQIWDCYGILGQKFRAESSGGGWFALQATHSGQCLEVADASTAAGGNIRQNSCNGDYHQQWKLEAVAGDLYRIANRNSGLYMEMAGAQATNNGVNIQQGTYDGSGDQKYRVLPTRGDHVALVSVNFPRAGMRNRNGEVWLEEGTTDDKLFKIRPGLTDSSCVSFESKSQPGRYLRHLNGLMFIQEAPEDDGTFCLKTGLASSGYSLEPKNLLNSYVRHQNNRLRVSPFENTNAYKLDAAWSLVQQ
ncbi:MAG: RICIN domain-containing protein [Deltaproteobacteria bacterium]|nr:RICIN domain-containing protein [Deltaproteobacteria bacterium]